MTCTHSTRVSVLDGRPTTCPKCEPWAFVFDGYIDWLNKEGGSSRWKVSPDTVRLFVKSQIDALQAKVKRLERELHNERMMKGLKEEGI